MSWTQVSSDKWQRADGFEVMRKMSGTWGWSPPGGRATPGARGKPTAEAAMLAVDDEHPMSPAAVQRELPSWSPERAREVWPLSEMVQRAQRHADDEARLAELVRRLEGDKPPSVVSPSFRLRDLEREDRERRSELLDKLIERATPEEAATLLGPPPSSALLRPTQRSAVDPEPASARLRELPSQPIAVINPRPAAFARSAAPIDPPTARPVVERPSSVPTRRWAPPIELIHEAAPSTRPGPPPQARPRVPQVQAQASQAQVPTYKRAADSCSREAILAALAAHPGNKSAAARALGLTRNGLYGALHRMGWQAEPETRALRAQSGNAGANKRWS